MKKKGSVLGGVFLIAGSCIGAGMLALPILSGLTGYFPSMFLTFLAWGFMTFTALLLVEANGWFKKQVNIVSIAEKALGLPGKVISWFLYLFLFYSILVAYIAGGGDIFTGFIDKIFNIGVNQNLIALLFAIVLGFVVYFGTKTVDHCNRFFMVGLITAYLGMIFLGIFKIQKSNLFHVNLKYLIMPLPVLIVSFGFHNMIPTLTAYFQGDLKKMRKTVLLGSLLSLFIYVCWQTVVIGIIPVTGEKGLLEAFFKGQQATASLQYYLKSSIVGIVAQFFAFFAIVTSFLAQSLGLMHFIADGMKVNPGRKNNIWLIFLTLIPPTLFAVTYPEVFFKALSFAGGFCAVILFGIFPALMAWIGRYREKYQSDYHVFGGKTALVFAILFSTFLALNELARIFGINALIPY